MEIIMNRFKFSYTTINVTKKHFQNTIMLYFESALKLSIDYINVIINPYTIQVILF